MSDNPQMPNIQIEIDRVAKATGRAIDMVREEWSERAAIREHLGGMARHAAEGRAAADIGVRALQLTQDGQ